ncbi:hypothetical protein MA16_Dca002430 [Dendrobium catenatum]|uniref:Retrotransposon gag domain-containing protein n=1 Tax=Dendrobium catenatum TaxID=906689 RepID=A0A2I0W0H7_9ASPA|nr:hypothetical protein MA16_Dca002430 [Dendrobium catenatum]
MKQLMRGYFFPTDFEQMLYLTYQHCVQGNYSVSEYTEEFFRLSVLNNLNESNNQLVARYIGGLKDVIEDKIELNMVGRFPKSRIFLSRQRCICLDNLKVHPTAVIIVSMLQIPKIL